MKIEDFTQGDLRDDVVSKNSVLNEVQYVDNIAFDSQFEGVPSNSVMYGGTQVKKKDYADTTAGIWIGIDSDGKAKTNIGDSTNSVKWNGSTLAIAGALSASSLDIPDTTTADSFHVNTSGDAWWGATAIGSAIAKILKTGIATFTNVSITGGSVSGTTTVGIANVNLAARGWTQTCAFSATDGNTVAWGAGTLTSADGTSYSISASNTDTRLTAASLTSPMNAKTYIYLDIAQSSTEYQCTYTATSAIGSGKVLVAVAENNTTEAVYTVFSDRQSNIDASTIVASSITANEIAASTITGAKILTMDLTSKTITADTGTIGGWTLGSTSLSATSGGNTTTLSSGATAFSSGPTATPTTTITQTGLLTAVGLTSLNMKAYTSFEGSGRFTLTGDIAPTFGNNGMVVAPGTVATHYARALWWITNYVFNNNPTFTCSLVPLTPIAGDGVGFVGLGLPTITGSGMTETGKNYCGFELKKAGGVLTVIAIQCDGGGTATFSGTLQTLAVDDALELYIKVNASSINYYTRLNGGAISAVTTLSATMPTGAETYISFVTSNKGGTDDFKIQFQCAAYEH